MLRAFGCSFTYGTSCKNPATDSWPVLLSKMLKTDCKNYGLSGASNDYFFKTISENINQFDKDDIIVVMMVLRKVFQVYQIQYLLMERSFNLKYH